MPTAGVPSRRQAAFIDAFVICKCVGRSSQHFGVCQFCENDVDRVYGVARTEEFFDPTVSHTDPPDFREGFDEIQELFPGGWPAHLNSLVACVVSCAGRELGNTSSRIGRGMATAG